MEKGVSQSVSGTHSRALLLALLAVAAGMVFLVKAGVLAGMFYLASVVMFITAILMALFPEVGVLLFGIMTALCFFIPGLKYYRQRTRRLKIAADSVERG